MESISSDDSAMSLDDNSWMSIEDSSECDDWDCMQFVFNKHGPDTERFEEVFGNQEQLDPYSVTLRGRNIKFPRRADDHAGGVLSPRYVLAASSQLSDPPDWRGWFDRITGGDSSNTYTHVWERSDIEMREVVVVDDGADQQFYTLFVTANDVNHMTELLVLTFLRALSLADSVFSDASYLIERKVNRINNELEAQSRRIIRKAYHDREEMGTSGSNIELGPDHFKEMMDFVLSKWNTMTILELDVKNEPSIYSLSIFDDKDHMLPHQKRMTHVRFPVYIFQRSEYLQSQKNEIVEYIKSQV